MPRKPKLSLEDLAVESFATQDNPVGKLQAAPTDQTAPGFTQDLFCSIMLFVC
jgi:hypothetical protein